MTSKGVKAMIAKGVTVGLLAGAFALAAPAKAEAQQFAERVQVGFPHYDHVSRDRYERMRIEEARRRAEWMRAHERSRFGYDHRR